VLTTAPIYDAFYAEYASLRAFLHSHSYTGNPLACRAALATLDIFATDQVIDRNRALAAYLGARSAALGELPHVAEVRQRGMIVAIEMVRDKKNRTPFDWRERRGLRVYRHGLENEVLLRPVGNVVYFMPPYVINQQEIDLMVDVAMRGIELATCD
jgi:adenosylmethionine-8-amino-7-oxononanoate aminotransferase